MYARLKPECRLVTPLRLLLLDETVPTLPDTSDLRAISRRDDERAWAELVKLNGIARWSAKVYLPFALERPDARRADDLGLLLMAQRLKALQRRPSGAALQALARLGAPRGPSRPASLGNSTSSA